MLKIIDGKRYNTKTAEHVASDSNDLGCSDFRHYDEDLYVTKKGNFFLAGEGGPMSKYARQCGDMTGGGEDITVLTRAEAQKYLERIDAVDALETYFADEIEEG